MNNLFKSIRKTILLFVFLPAMIYSQCNQCSNETLPISGINTIATGYGTEGYYSYSLHHDTPVVENAHISISLNDLDTGTEPVKKIELYARSLGFDGDDAGHILANRLGGCACYINIFPQSPHINRGSYRILEEKIYNCIKNNPDTVASIKWSFSYNGDSTRPIGVSYHVRFTSGNCKQISKDFKNKAILLS